MKCPKCHFEQEDQNKECLRCGIVFEKYGNPISRRNRRIAREGDNKEQHDRSFPQTVFLVEQNTNPFYFGGRALIYLVTFVWGWVFILTPLEKITQGAVFFTLSTFLSMKRAIFSSVFWGDG